MKKWIFLVVILIFAATIFCAIRDTYYVQLDEIEIVLPDMPAALDGYRILHISDFHGRHFPKDGAVAKMVMGSKPDIIVLTGDYVHNDAAQIYNLYPLLEVMVRTAPVYAVSGNHDHWSNWPIIKDALETAGVDVLDNQYVRLRRNGRSFILAGVSDPYKGYDDLQAALPGNVTGTVLLLAHAPTWFEPLYQDLFGGLPVYAAKQEQLEKVSLILCGHTHGGQIKLPFLGAVTTASGRLFPKTYVDGLSREKNSWLYISRGIGQSGILPIRFLSRAQITLIVLRSPDAS